ncbi:MAG: outer membrane lipoprotein LolB [Gammaproteobacteria bacterium]|nr:lipoprotein insertase outer membrane protein LolB [Gammaproteobacteria bacterium]NND54782.1 outer membrane lipoprotein LolB [Gammaproteobacteria bacterium]
MRLRTLRPLLPAMLILSGCTSLQTATTPATDWDARRASLLQQPNWSLTGRVAIRTVDGEGGQARLSWTQSGEATQLQLAGPFGAGRVDLSVTPVAVTLQTGDGQAVRYAGPEAAEQFMDEQLGWSFPVRSARYWMLGLLDPAAPGERLFDDAGGLTALRQHGWDISLNRYATVDSLLLPTRLTLENPQLRLKTAISNWAIAELN